MHSFTSKVHGFFFLSLFLKFYLTLNSYNLLPISGDTAFSPSAASVNFPAVDSSRRLWKRGIHDPFLQRITAINIILHIWKELPHPQRSLHDCAAAGSMPVPAVLPVRRRPLLRCLPYPLRILPAEYDVQT